MAPDSDPKESGGSDKLLDDDSAGALAELLLSSPVSEAPAAATEPLSPQSPPPSDLTTWPRPDSGELTGPDEPAMDHQPEDQPRDQPRDEVSASARAVIDLSAAETLEPDATEPEEQPVEAPDPAGAERELLAGNALEPLPPVPSGSGLHDVGSTSHSSYPGVDTGEVPPIDDVLELVGPEHSTKLSRLHQPEPQPEPDANGELGAFTPPLRAHEGRSQPPTVSVPGELPPVDEAQPGGDDVALGDALPPAEVRPTGDALPGGDAVPAGDAVPGGDAVPTDEASVPGDSEPSIRAVPVTNPSASATGPAQRLMFSTETVPGSMRRSTVVHEPDASVPEGESPLVPPENRGLFLDAGPVSGIGRARLDEPTPSGGVAALIPTALLEVTDRRWFWRAVASTVALLCVGVGYLFVRGDGTETDAALPTSIVAAESSSTTSAASTTESEPLAPSASLEINPAPAATSSTTSSTVADTNPRVVRTKAKRGRSTTRPEDPTSTTIDPTTSSSTTSSTTIPTTTTTLQVGPPTVPPTTPRPTTTVPTTTIPTTTTTLQVGPPTVPPTTPTPTTPVPTTPVPTTPVPTTPVPTTPTPTTPAPTTPVPTTPVPTTPVPTTPVPTTPVPTTPVPTTPVPTTPVPTTPVPTTPVPTTPVPTTPTPTTPVPTTPESTDPEPEDDPPPSIEEDTTIPDSTAPGPR